MDDYEEVLRGALSRHGTSADERAAIYRRARLVVKQSADIRDDLNLIVETKKLEVAIERIEQGFADGSSGRIEAQQSGAQQSGARQSGARQADRARYLAREDVRRSASDLKDVYPTRSRSRDPESSSTIADIKTEQSTRRTVRSAVQKKGHRDSAAKDSGSTSQTIVWEDTSLGGRFWLALLCAAGVIGLGAFLAKSSVEFNLEASDLLSSNIPAVSTSAQADRWQGTDGQPIAPPIIGRLASFQETDPRLPLGTTSYDAALDLTQGDFNGSGPIEAKITIPERDIRIELQLMRSAEQTGDTVVRIRFEPGPDFPEQISQLVSMNLLSESFDAIRSIAFSANGQSDGDWQAYSVQDELLASLNTSGSWLNFTLVYLSGSTASLSVNLKGN